MTGAGSIRLVVFDLDGTLLRRRTVCELIAAPLGQERRMAELERLTSWEDVRQARYEITSWYAGRTEEELAGYVSRAELAPGAREGILLLQEAGVEVLVASLTWRFAVNAVARRLGVDAILGTDLDPEDWSVAKHSWPVDKRRSLIEAATLRDIPLERVGAVGDSPGDLPMLGAAGIGVYVGLIRPTELPEHVLHAPDADIRSIAINLLTRAERSGR